MKRILIIDDEPELVKAVEIRLKANGYEVDIAHDGLSGLDKTKEIKPDLILLDIIMPKIDGEEVCRRFKSNPETKEIPIIIFTASGQRDLEKKCMLIGATGIIKKPFETEELLNMVNKILHEK